MLNLETRSIYHVKETLDLFYLASEDRQGLRTGNITLWSGLLIEKWVALYNSQGPITSRQYKT